MSTTPDKKLSDSAKDFGVNVAYRTAALQLTKRTRGLLADALTQHLKGKARATKRHCRDCGYLVNLSGSLVLGVLLGLIHAEGQATSWVLTLIGVGFCGSLTTFGGYAAQVLDFVVAPRSTPPAARLGHAVEYAAASVLACFAVSLVGYLAAVALSGGAG